MATTATTFNEASLTNDYLQGLVSGFVWSNASPLTYHLAFSDFNNNGTNDWDEDGAGTAARLAFQLWANVANLTITEVGTAAAANMVEGIADAGGALGFHYFPGGGDQGESGLTLTGDQNYGQYNQGGTGWDATGLLQGGYGFITLIHEIGHGLGLEHPHDTDLFPEVSDSTSTGAFNLNQGIYTTMSYNDGWATGLYAPTNDYGYQGTPMALDIAAIQEIYGANMSYNTGNDTYTLADTNASGTFYSGIWDAGGTDEISYSGARDAYVFLGEATIDQSATGGGLLSFVMGINGGYTIAQNAVIENGTTGSGDDLLDGNDGNNVLNAGAGNDAVVGRLGSDTINGGDGNDLLIGDFEGLSNLQTVDPTLGGGISLGSGSVTADMASANISLGSAIDLSSSFSLAANANIQDATTSPHVTVFGTGNDQRDYYSVTINNPFSTIRVDLDNTSGTFDGMVAIANSSGNIVRLGDDSIASVGAGGSTVDYGSVNSTDSYIEWTPHQAGTYYIIVGAYSGLDVVPAGATYELQVSVDNELGGASPYAPFLDYFNFSATGGAADTINGGIGDDTIYGGDGNDTLNGGADNDLIDGGAGADIMDGGAGFDILTYVNAGSAVSLRLWQQSGLLGDAAGDTITGFEHIIGSSFDDTIIGSGASGERLDGGNGNDTLWALAGDDTINGGNGNDIINGGAGADILNGNTGFDTLTYANASSGVSLRLWQRAGLTGDAAGDTLSGFEHVIGSSYNDVIVGSGLTGEILDGMDGNDVLFSLRGSDTINGGNGNDILAGGGGADVLTGGAGSDVFKFQSGGDGTVVTDFVDDTDTLDLSTFGFADINAAMAAMTQVGNDVEFTFNSDTFVIQNIVLATLSDDIFV